MVVRIKKGVKPYGGRRFSATREVKPNGRTVFNVNVRNIAVFGTYGADIRVYREDEIDVLEED